MIQLAYDTENKVTELAAMNNEQFQKSAAGHLIQVGQGEEAYWAFVPHPLPPNLSFTKPLWLTLSKADRAVGQLAGVSRHLSNTRLLLAPFVRREAVLSSRIEGTQADIFDLYMYEAGQLALPGIRGVPPEADVREVLNYVLALEYGINRLETLPVSLRLIQELHHELMRGVRGEFATPGEFRHTQNWIGYPGSTLRTATYVPPPVTEMTRALHELEMYLHDEDDYPPLARLAFVHYQFEAIHPFVDGNGRIGRLLLSLLLIDWGLLDLPVLYLSAYFERNRETYYDLLQAVTERGAWQEWLLFFLQGIVEQAQDTTQKLKELQDLQHFWRQFLADHPSAGTLLRVVDLLFKRPILTAADVQEELKITHRTANRVLQELTQLSIVREITGRQRGRLYEAMSIFKVLQD